MKKMLLLTATLFLAGCAATPSGAPSGAGAGSAPDQVKVVESFTDLSSRSGFCAGSVSSASTDALSEGELASLKSALTAGLKSRGVLVGCALPQSLRITLEVMEASRAEDASSATIQMSVHDTHNSNLLGSAEAIGGAPAGDLEGALRSAVDTLLDFVVQQFGNL